MMIHWDHFQDNSKLVDQLSSGALQRIARGLNATVSASCGRKTASLSFLPWKTLWPGGNKSGSVGVKVGQPARYHLSSVY